MTTLLFVHGTGIREKRYAETYNIIKCSLQEMKSDLTVLGCFWGEKYGAKLQAEGACIPTYNSARAIEVDETLRDAEYSIILWEHLYMDPLYELRTLSILPASSDQFVPGQLDLSQQLNKRIRDFKPDKQLDTILQLSGGSSVFEEARKTVIGSIPYLDAINTLNTNSKLLDYYAVIARALIAQLILISREREFFTRVEIDAIMRDELVMQLSNNFSGGISNRGVSSWMKKQMMGLVEIVLSGYAQRRRGALSDSVNPAAGDILLYQGRGEQIRAFIKNEIEKASEPVILMGHSLGGIACVDLLVLEKMPQVKLLVTVGSQSPFFYEIGALQSLAFGDDLPTYFPRWLNIYDLRDFLSFVGATVFKGRVEDVVVDSHQPFPVSHGAYFTNPDVYKAIITRLP